MINEIYLFAEPDPAPDQVVTEIRVTRSAMRAVTINTNPDLRVSRSAVRAVTTASNPGSRVSRSVVRVVTVALPAGSGDLHPLDMG
jgi:hypothetical protein